MNLSEREHQENLKRVYREAAFQKVHVELGSLTMATALSEEPQLVPLTEAIKSVLESK